MYFEVSLIPLTLTKTLGSCDLHHSRRPESIIIPAQALYLDDCPFLLLSIWSCSLSKFVKEFSLRVLTNILALKPPICPALASLIY